ncbi:MAG: hypothetical protein WKG01_25775 [Kofleriaceae bacterium]
MAFGNIPNASQIINHVAEGDIAEPTAELAKEATLSNFAVTITALVRRGTTPNDLADYTKLVLREAAVVFSTIVGMPEGSLVALPQFVMCIEVDDARFERWRIALGRSSDCRAECELSFLRYPLPEQMLSTAASCTGYMLAARLDGLSSEGVDDGMFVPPHFVDSGDAVAWFWYHACAGHFVNDDSALAVLSELNSRVTASLASERVVVLSAEVLNGLYDAVGREWLAGKAEKRTMKAKANPPYSSVRQHRKLRSRNVAIEAFTWLASDRSVALNMETAWLVDLWISASQLSSCLQVIERRAPRMVAGAVERLQVVGPESSRKEFEVETLAIMLGLGHAAAFEDAGQVRTPDIRISHEAGDVFIECSRKDPSPEHVEQANQFAVQLVEYVHRYSIRHRKSFVIDIRFNLQYQTRWQAPLMAHVKSAMGGGDALASGSDSEWSCEVRKLGEWNQVWKSESLMHLVPGASLVLIAGEWHDRWSARGLLFHSSLVTVSLDTTRSLVKSLENTLRDKGRQRSSGGQVPDGAAMVCTVALGTLDDVTVAEVLAEAPRLLSARSSVSALSLFWAKRVTEKLVTKAAGLAAASFLNANARVPLPSGFQLPHGPLQVAGLISRDQP